jgi:pyruvate kinase
MSTTPTAPRATPATSTPAKHARTKIVATVGPACRDEAKLEELVIAGVDVFRLNMAHASPDQHLEVVHWIRSVSRRIGRPIAILCDLAGPKIRLGELPNGLVECREGDKFRFVSGTVSNNPNEFVSTYEPLVREVTVGDSVMLADGTVGLVVEAKGTDYADCRVVQSGEVRSRQGINLPGVKLSVPSMSQSDWQHAMWAADNQIDYVSLSFVRTPNEVRLLKELLRTRGSKAQVVAKIEKQEALDHLEEIVKAADGVMVARGDLGVEIDVARMPMMQKLIVAMCHRYQRPVIIATQMLDSMTHSRRPTRAEATDVANAILDGCDACMLSGETAIGDYPRTAVEMMNRIALATEERTDKRLRLPESEYLAEGLHPTTQAVVRGVSRIAEELNARLIVVASSSGVTALAMAKERNEVETVVVSDDEASLRRVCLYWGVIPLGGMPTKDTVHLLEHVTAWGRKEGRLNTGDRIVLVAGSGLGAGGHNMAIVHEVS